MTKPPQTLAVVGIGYVGLPVALLASEKGWRVIGIDNNEDKVHKVNQGIMPYQDKDLAAQLKQYPIQADTDYARAAEADVIIIAVPTPVKDNHEPDLTPLLSAVTGLRPHLRPGQILVVESTINPGVMDEAVVPALRERADLKLDADQSEGEVLHLAHCPERINPGDSQWTVRNIPRVVGGYTPAGTAKAREFYESIIEAQIKPMASVQEAEAVKILENTFRDVNIAFINEMAKSFAKLDVDILHVIEGAATKPFAFMPHYPGNGVGGHCISVDPYYMIERGRQAGFDHEFLKLARQINNGMPDYTVKLLADGLDAAGLDPKTTKIALLGLAYKKNIDDLRESPALEIRHLLEQAGYELNVYDPYAPALSTVHSLADALADAPVVMIATDHSEFTSTLTPEYLKNQAIKLVIDGKNSLNGPGIAEADIPYYGIGRRY